MQRLRPDVVRDIQHSRHLWPSSRLRPNFDPLEQLYPEPKFISTRPAFFTDIQGTTLHYRYHCRPGVSPLTLLLVHGFGASLESWHDVTPLLATRYRLASVDLQGSGFSAKPRHASYTLHDQAALVAGFVSRIPAKNVVMVGHSYGGAVTFMAYLRLRASKLASRIRGLVMIDSASYVQKLPFFITSLRHPLLRFLARNLTTPEWRTRHVLRRIFVDKARVDRDRVARYAYFLRLPGAEYALARAAVALPPSDAEQLSALLPTIDVPTQILWGALDPVIPLARAYQLRRDIPHSRLDVIPGTGHVPHEERPEVTASIILRFLERV